MSSENAHATGRARGARSDDRSDARPGGVLGIPETAAQEDVVDAVPDAGGPAGAEGSGMGIDPGLLPYLEAADDVDEAGPAADESWARAEAEDLEALRELIAANMIGDGDPERLDALLAEVDQDESDDRDDPEPRLPDTPADDARDAEDGHRAELRAAAHAVEVAERMRDVEAEILSRAPEHRVQPSLERVRAVLDLLGNPERAYRTVHIAGTNGKTSTARMTERLLAATGMRTGRFTSPHLATIRERISLDGEPIGQEGFIAAWEDVAPYVEMVDERSVDAGGPRMSFFEVLTVMSLAAFADAPVDVAILEVGMGGTWDCTNVVPGDVEIITPVGLDHSAWLGTTIEEVAANKAGIIKDGAILVTARQMPDAEAVIAAAAAAHGVVRRRELDPEEDPDDPGAGVLEVVDRTLAVGGQMATLRTAAAVYEDVFIPLHGDYQVRNALLALAAAEAVFGGRALPAKVVEDGFAAVTSPGRLEVLRSSPTVVVDAGHNPHGLEALVPAVEETFGFGHLVAVVGVMADKDVEGMLAVLEPVCDAVVCVPVDSPRAMEVEELAAVAREVFGADRAETADTLAGGIEIAVTLSEGFDAPLTSAGVLIVGSVVLAAQARALLGAIAGARRG